MCVEVALLFIQCSPVSPLLAPLSFGRDVVDSGDFAQLSCIAMKGDEPLSVSWTFHGATGDPGIVTSPIGKTGVSPPEQQ